MARSIPANVALPAAGLLGLLSLGLRALRARADGGLVDISHEAQLGLARAVAGPLRLDLDLGGVHPGQAKAPLHPLLAAAVGGVFPDARGAALALTWLYAAALIPAVALLAHRLWGPRTAVAAAVTTASLPVLAGDLREYALLAALVVLGAERLLAFRARPSWATALPGGLLAGLAATSRWEGLAWGLLLLVAWTLVARRRPAMLAGAAVTAAAAFALPQYLAYPTSSFLQRLDERTTLVAQMTRSFAGSSLDDAAIDSLHGAGGLAQASPPGSFVADWLAALPAAAVELGGLLLHPLGWPTLVLALLGARRLGRIASGGPAATRAAGPTATGPTRTPLAVAALTFATIAAASLALSFMPAKAGYLLLPACALALLAGRGLAGLADRLALPLGLLLLAAGLLAGLDARLDPEHRDHLARLHRAADALDAALPPGAHLLAEEDLCVLRLAERPCTFLPPPAPDADQPLGPAAIAWLTRRAPTHVVLDDSLPDTGPLLRQLDARDPHPLGDGWILAALP